MAGFLYYIEGATADVKIEALRQFGLGHAFASNGDFTATPITCGPGDSPGGIVVAAMSRLGECALGLYPDQQKWRAGSHPQVQIGYYTEHPPTPEDLARSRLLDGYFVTLGDGNRWLIPIARGCQDDDADGYWYEALPKGMTLNDDRQWVSGDVIPVYEALWTIAQRWADAVFNSKVPDIQGADPVTVDVEFETNVGTAARIALSANYRIDDPEIALLDLFSDERFVYEILNATVDMLRWLALLKKKQSRDLVSGSNTADGPQGDTQAIAQV